ncbi:peptide chain release factor N(5)-glutamine methyltransferase [Rhabdaerophilum sp. SD176]|uniref:peptide chain release factor N(5)-glutamine methyltransferase n=1 Tax=Rhabdaerophilum sp. SD176 TaxID=2983548 RepID=UPI0024E0010C|nr:peptide chain release factor N(5)-glutamine methyltransferase [Rhabdaerophilum sp. SD176]
MSGDFPPGLSLAAAQARIEAQLAEAGIDEPRREARLLLAAATGVGLATLLARPDMPVGEAGAAIARFLAARLDRMPLSRILGRREFYGLEFRLNAATLDPRGDTETLVDAVLAWLDAEGRRGESLRLLDLGTGTGAILLALLSHLPQATGLGIDIAAEAVAAARINATTLGLDGRAEFRTGDLLTGLDGMFHIIVSNPPYIPTGDLAGLDPEVRRHDPVLALDGGADGLDFYRRILADAPARLLPGGLLAVEVGAGQAPAVAEGMRHAGFLAVSLQADLAGIARVVAGRQPDREKERD